MKEEKERLAYLRNVVIIARSDGEVSAAERVWLVKIQTAIGASADSLQRALNEFGDPEIDFSEILRFSDRVRCVEDMVVVAICDGQLEAEERQLLIQATLATGLSQDQIDTITTEAQQRDR